MVNASSEKGGLAVNGMSYHARDSKNANSALIVTVTPQDFPDASACNWLRQVTKHVRLHIVRN